MNGLDLNKNPLRRRGIERQKLKRRLRQWQQARSWARLIREAEHLWKVDSRELKRLGALELTQLLQEVPQSYRRRVNLWLIKYSVATRFGN
ncbi:hypothetical protein [Prochlorococcus marinus]|uniref:Uncharacterized protein n=1 Tax=Prochlorococcus marinus (strain MIT 9211) TaxID=93059 RepID=A9B9Z6_PROM4|nr:hypothetical protein [Prochlorococcus marinus]ABX08658.1 Hypothetical protein P9211_07271 [Prochlorococcus marinus str. MIT 9211]